MSLNRSRRIYNDSFARLDRFKCRSAPHADHMFKEAGISAANRVVEN
jgi:hypothetical protein